MALRPDIGPNPIAHWCKPLRVSDLCKDDYRPPRAKSLVYVITQSDENGDLVYVGAAHATKNTDGRARVGTLIGAILDFGVWHARGIKIAEEFSLQDVANFYVMWGVIEGCPIEAERALLKWHLSTGVSPLLVASKPRTPAYTSFCREQCAPKRHQWSSLRYP